MTDAERARHIRHRTYTTLDDKMTMIGDVDGADDDSPPVRDFGGFVIFSIDSRTCKLEYDNEAHLKRMKRKYRKVGVTFEVFPRQAPKLIPLTGGSYVEALKEIANGR